jgi:lipopolysaccharide/colanic/teichoic acid biosynthesis glycosyltransferase
MKPWYERRSRWLNQRASQRLKRLMDVSLCVVTLPATVLLLALCCLAIKLDSAGTALFVQERTGKGGRRFRMYKLRTMVLDAETLKSQYQAFNKRSDPDFKLVDDPRSTRVGRFLRKTSLDELPQIFNVLRGEMSWVGPRPTSFDITAYHLWHTARLACLPGITGLWQVSGRDALTFDERTRLDIAYIRRQSLWLDLRILWCTVGYVLGGRGE